MKILSSTFHSDRKFCPRSLLEMSRVEYSKRYTDTKYEYKHVLITEEMATLLPEFDNPLAEHQWRSLGIQLANGWLHYETRKRTLMFRKLLMAS